MKKIMMTISALLIVVGCSNEINKRIPPEIIPEKNSTIIQDEYGNTVAENCQMWFDGCNGCKVMENGGLACTRKYCEKTMLESAKCLDSESVKTEKIKEDNMKDEAGIFCTMEYDPVCGMDGKTYGNSCKATEIAKTEIAHQGKCE